MKYRYYYINLGYNDDIMTIDIVLHYNENESVEEISINYSVMINDTMKAKINVKNQYQRQMKSSEKAKNGVKHENKKDSESENIENEKQSKEKKA